MYVSVAYKTDSKQKPRLRGVDRRSFQKVDGLFIPTANTTPADKMAWRVWLETFAVIEVIGVKDEVISSLEYGLEEGEILIGVLGLIGESWCSFSTGQIATVAALISVAEDRMEDAGWWPTNRVMTNLKRGVASGLPGGRVWFGADSCFEGL